MDSYIMKKKMEKINQALKIPILVILVELIAFKFLILNKLDTADWAKTFGTTRLLDKSIYNMS